MSEERHTVLVHENQVQEYLDRGYRLEEQSADDYMNSSALQPPPGLFKQHRVMTIGAIEKEKLDTPKRKFSLRTVEHIFVPNQFEVRRYDILDDGSMLRMVADSERDSGPEEIHEWELFNTPRECVHAARAQLLREVEKLRQAADAIIAFLKRYEAL